MNSKSAAALIQIGRATVADAPDLLRLLSVQLREHHVRLEDAGLARAIDGVLANPARGFFLLLAVDGRRVGAAYVSFVWALEHGGHSAWLEELYVEPARRAEGFGTELLRAVLAECEACGCAALDLEIDADHERVRSLYRRHGFHELPRRRLAKRLGAAGPVDPPDPPTPRA